MNSFLSLLMLQYFVPSIPVQLLLVNNTRSGTLHMRDRVFFFPQVGEYQGAYKVCTIIS